MKQLIIIPAMLLSVSAPAVLFAAGENNNNLITINGGGEVDLGHQVNTSQSVSTLESTVLNNAVVEGRAAAGIASNQLDGSFSGNAGVASISQDTGSVSNYQSGVSIQSNIAQRSQVSAATLENFNSNNAVSIGGGGSVALAATLNSTKSRTVLESSILTNDLSASNPTPFAVNRTSGGSFNDAAGIYTLNQNTGDASSTGQSVNIQSSLGLDNGATAATGGAPGTNSSNNRLAIAGFGNISVADTLNQSATDNILEATTDNNSYPGSSGNLNNQFTDSFNRSSGIVTASQTSAQAVNAQQAVSIQSANGQSVPVANPIARNSTRDNLYSVNAGAITSAGVANQSFARASLKATSGTNTAPAATADDFTVINNGITGSYSDSAGIYLVNQDGGHASISQQSATLQTDSSLAATAAQVATPAPTTTAAAPLVSGNSTATIAEGGQITFADRLSEAVSSNTLEASSTGKAIAVTAPVNIAINSIQDSFNNTSAINIVNQNAGLENIAQQSLVLQSGNLSSVDSEIELALPENRIGESLLSDIVATIDGDGSVITASDLSRAIAVSDISTVSSDNRITLAAAGNFVASNVISGSFNNGSGITFVNQAGGIASTASQSITIQSNNGI